MALIDNVFYVDYGNGSSTGYYAVAAYSNKAWAAGALLRQLTAPAVGSERVFVVTTAGTATGEPTWVNTRGALNSFTGAGVCQECTGLSGFNGDITNTPTWSVSQTWVLGQHIYDSGTASIQICTVAGAGKTSGSPTFSATAGVTATDTSATWTSCGLASAFTGWNAPHARVQNAYTATWGQAGNSFFVASEHAETQAATMTMNSPGTAALPCQTYCVTKTTLPPGPSNITTGATITTTGANSILVEGASPGSNYFNGFTFNTGTGSTTANLSFNNTGSNLLRFDNCTFALLNTGSAAIKFGGNSPSAFEWNNCSVYFSAAAQNIALDQGTFLWQNPTAPVLAAGSTQPTSFLTGNANTAALLEGLDLSALTGTVVGSALTSVGTVTLKDCKLPSSGTLVGTITGQGCPDVYIARSDSAATNYRNEKYSYGGTQTTSGGSSNNIADGVYRTGGAQDGGTPISWKIATTAHPKWFMPFRAMWAPVWNTVVSSIGVTGYGIVNAAAVPNNDGIWFDVEYLNSTGSPLGAIATGTKASNLASGTALTADTSSWSAPARQNSNAYSVGNAISVPDNPGLVFFCTASSGNSNSSEPGGYATAIDGGSVTDGSCTFRAGCRFSQTLTISPNLVGLYYIYWKAALASTTFFIDPQ
jgi:hypothetical protein